MFFSLPLCSDTVSISLRLVCLVGVCACASVKFCMCVLILVAATRSYSRSTGALHTPDTFGAAGEGWVHLFLRTSPTHFSLIFSFCSLRFCCSCATHLLLCYLSACFFSFVHPPCFFFFLTLCSRMSNLPVESHVSARSVASLTTILPILPASICFLYLALPRLCRDSNIFSCVFCQSFFLPSSGTCGVA